MCSKQTESGAKSADWKERRKRRGSEAPVTMAMTYIYLITGATLRGELAGGFGGPGRRGHVGREWDGSSEDRIADSRRHVRTILLNGT